MILHGYWRSSTSYRVRIALNLKGLAYRTSPVNLRDGEQYAEAFRELNPNASLPALEFEGRVHTQSLAILDMLDEQFPDPPLLPSGAEDRARCRELAYAIATETHAPLNLRNLTWLREHAGFDSEQVKAWAGFTMGATFAPLETRLAAMRYEGELPFGVPTLFEIMLVPQLYNARRFSMDLGPYPLLMRIDAHCRALDAFEKAAPEAQPDAPQEG